MRSLYIANLSLLPKMHVCRPSVHVGLAFKCVAYIFQSQKNPLQFETRIQFDTYAQQ